MLAINEDGPVLRVELNRPESLNCLDDDVLLEVTDLYTRLQQRFDLKAVVLGGRGRAFCAGADLRNPPGFAGTGGRERRYHSQIGYRACQAIADCEVVTIARLHGHVVGGGFALALACDFRIAAADTVFRLPEVDLVPTEPTSTCGPNWEPITALALWAEPEQEKPVAPFRWVGYEGDAGHGCGNHLHLSWNHAPAKPYELAEWVEVFPVAPGSARKPRRKKAAPKGPKGGVVQATTGGLGTHSK